MIQVAKIALFTVCVTAIYTYVGQWVPQQEVHPPKDIEIRPTMTTEEMVEAGRQIVTGKGTCLGCHTMHGGKGERFPDLVGVGKRAQSRKEGLGDVEYLAESLYEPNAFIVPGYNPGMTPVHKPPIQLNDSEILAVIAYLQSLGGTPTVTMKTILPYRGTASASLVGPPGKQLLEQYACNACHLLTAPGRLVGPSLFDVGKRLDRASIRESIMDPDASVAEGYPRGIMSATLKGTGFYDKVSQEQLDILVDYLAQMKGETK